MFSLMSPQITGTTDVLIENLRLISSLSKSLIVFPSATLPRRLVMPPMYANASTRLVLPEPPCPRTTTLRILSVVYTFIRYSSNTS